MNCNMLLGFLIFNILCLFVLTILFIFNYIKDYRFEFTYFGYIIGFVFIILVNIISDIYLYIEYNNTCKDEQEIDITINLIFNSILNILLLYLIIYNIIKVISIFKKIIKLKKKKKK